MRRLLKPALALLAGSVIFIGLPLLGWGIGDTSRFFDHPVRLTYTIIIILLLFQSVYYNWESAKKSDNHKQGFPRHTIDLLLIQLFCLAIVFVAPYTDSHSAGLVVLGDTLRYIGLIPMIFGFILMEIAEKKLDRQFSVEITIQENHQLITDGPFKYIRHPRYLGIMLFFSGIALVFSSLSALVLVAALMIVLIWRIFAEESLLKQEFSQKWDDYCKKTWRLIPYIF